MIISSSSTSSFSISFTNWERLNIALTLATTSLGEMVLSYSHQHLVQALKLDQIHRPLLSTLKSVLNFYQTWLFYILLYHLFGNITSNTISSGCSVSTFSMPLHHHKRLRLYTLLFLNYILVRSRWIAHHQPLIFLWHSVPPNLFIHLYYNWYSNRNNIATHQIYIILIKVINLPLTIIRNSNFNIYFLKGNFNKRNMKFKQSECSR